MPSCPTTDRFEALLDGRLASDEAAIVRDHMDGCSECLIAAAREARKRFPADSRPRAPSPGEVLAGRFELLEVLGEGAFGVVWKSASLESGGLVAIKLLRSSDQDAIQRLLMREARLGSRVRHDAFVPVREVLTLDSEQPGLVMDLLEGRDLAAHLNDCGTPSLQEALEILQQLTAALAALHAEKIAHRDLKPGNIFLEHVGPDSFRVRILDLGMARSFDLERRTTSSIPITQDGTILGTPRYMAPEQLQAEGVGVAADIWALGAIAFRLLTGRHHIESIEPAQTLRALALPMPDPSDFSRGVPEPVLQLVRGSLQFEAAQRPTAVDWVAGLSNLQARRSA
jgi:eukaryotic-like serine/threonine-protein kinase